MNKQELIQKFRQYIAVFFLTLPQETNDQYIHHCDICKEPTMYSGKPNILYPEQLYCLSDKCIGMKLETEEELQGLIYQQN